MHHQATTARSFKNNWKMKRSFLLMEILTSSFIAGLIVTACISLLLLFVSSKKHEEELLTTSQKQWQSASYLRWVIMNITQRNKHLFVVEEGPANSKKLIFHLNHGINSSPNDSSEMLAMLYLDKEKGLMLVHRPLKKMKELGFEEEKAYPIWPNAKEVKWSFFNQDELTPDSLQRKGEWKESWSKEEKNLPLAIRAIVTEKSPNNKDFKLEVTGIILSQLKDAKIQVK